MSIFGVLYSGDVARLQRALQLPACRRRCCCVATSSSFTEWWR